MIDKDHYHVGQAFARQKVTVRVNATRKVFQVHAQAMTTATIPTPS